MQLTLLLEPLEVFAVARKKMGKYAYTLIKSKLVSTEKKNAVIHLFSSDLFTCCRRSAACCCCKRAVFWANWFRLCWAKCCCCNCFCLWKRAILLKKKAFLLKARLLTEQLKMLKPYPNTYLRLLPLWSLLLLKYTRINRRPLPKPLVNCTNISWRLRSHYQP